MGQPCWSKLYHTQGLRNIHMGLLIGRTRSAHAHWLDTMIITLFWRPRDRLRGALTTRTIGLTATMCAMLLHISPPPASRSSLSSPFTFLSFFEAGPSAVLSFSTAVLSFLS